MVIPTRNTLAVDAPKTFTSYNEVAGTNTIRWQNPNGFNASWAIQLGETGHEQTEVMILGTATPAGTAGTLTANTLYEHPANTPIYAIKYNQVVFERSTTGTAGTASPMTNGTITYSPDGTVTGFDDTTGSNSYAYRVYFRNSVTLGTSEESDWFTPLGFAFYSLVKIRERIKNKLWSADFLPNDTIIDDWINEWKDEMSNAVIAINEDYALGTIDISFDGTDGYGTITTTDFSQIRRMWITYNGNNFYESTKTYINDILPDQVFSSVNPRHAWRGDTIFQIFPDESGGTARISFYRFGTTMINDTDELPLPMRSFTKSFIDYGEAQALRKDGKSDWKDKLIEAQAGKADFVSKLVPRDKSSQNYIDIVENISGDDSWIP